MKERNLKNKNLKQKSNKGITLVALIITIIVLLILAVVAISAVNNTGIIQHAQNSTKTYTDERDKENTTLGNYVDILNHYNPNQKEETDDAKRMLEILYLLAELEDYDDKTAPEEEINRREAEISKLNAEYSKIIGENAISFYIESDNFRYGYLYNPESKKFFKSSVLEDGVELTYVLENDEANEMLEETIEFIEYLEEEFVGKTYEEVQNMYDNNEIIPKINEEFEASNNYIDFHIQIYSDSIAINYDKESKSMQGEKYELSHSLNVNEQTKKIEGYEAKDYLWGA